MKRTVGLLIAVLMILSVFSICTVSALPDQDSQGRYRIDVKNGHAENYDGDTITYADAGEEVYVFYDAEVPEGSYIAGMSVNDQYYVDQSYFIMPNSVANIYFVLEPQQYLTVDFRGSNKAYIPVEARSEVTSAINHAIINGFIKSTSTGFDLDKDGNSDVEYLFAVEKPFFRRIATCNIIGDYMLVLPKSNRKYNFIFSFGAPSIHKSSLSLTAGKTFTLKITDGTTSVAFATSPPAEEFPLPTFLPDKTAKSPPSPKGGLGIIRHTTPPILPYLRVVTEAVSRFSGRPLLFC